MKRFFLIISAFIFTSIAVSAQTCPRYVEGDSLKTTAPFSIYREFFKKGLYTDAYPYWKKIYEQAPGFRQQTYYDGVTYYTDLLQKTKDKDLLQKYADTLFQIYKKDTQCFGETEYMLGRKGIDLLKYGKDTDIPEARRALEKTIKLSGNKAYPYYIQTYFKILINQLGKDGVTEDFVKGKYDELSAVLDKNIADPNNSQLTAYKDVKSLIDDLYTQNFADKSDPADCAKLLEIYLKKYKANPNDLETVKTVYAKTKGCADSILNIELLKKLNTMAPSYLYANRLGSIYMKADKFDSAYVLYENALKVETDSSKKADMYYIMASIKANGNNYPAARELAKQALQMRPTMGKAYMLIGNMYLGSGKLCGPGTGFQSQIVLWPAFDYLKKAIEVGDEEVKTEAQKMISEYTKYLPTKAEVTAKKLKVGAPYTVKCWINEETTVKVK
ncbi:MAG TPA: hypothetical protein PKM51_01420 [Chitinophagales bacterium]|nr:hypothetical protein [Chitinophagales bacterium]HNM31380.1 hypothetical protein [Chitinophagales bacterium]